MAGGSNDEIRAHIESISARSERELTQLSDRLSGRSWPGGGGDRSHPGALKWLSRWKASGPVPLLPLCGCAGGRCHLCN
jgi:hypothetical protein